MSTILYPYGVFSNSEAGGNYCRQAGQGQGGNQKPTHLIMRTVGVYAMLLLSARAWADGILAKDTNNVPRRRSHRHRKRDSRMAYRRARRGGCLQWRYPRACMLRHTAIQAGSSSTSSKVG